MNFKTLLFLMILLSKNGFCQEFVELVDGAKRNFKSVNLIQEKFEKPYIKTEDGTIFRMETINSFQNRDGYFIKNLLTKNKNDFSERMLNGRVSIYRYDLSGNFIQNGQSNQRDYYAYQKYDEPLKQMIYANLIKDLGDNKLSVKKLKKIKKAKQIAPVYYISGSASILTAGILFNTTESDLATPLFIGGIGFFAIPFILNSQRQKRMDDAIKIYNAN